MNIHIAHDAAMLARLAGEPAPSCHDVWVKHNDPACVFGATFTGNPLAPDWLLDVENPGERFVIWSGWLGESDAESDPRTWGPPGQRALRQWCDQITPQLQRLGVSMCIRPNARHVLSDVPSCLTFMRERSKQPFSLCLDPVALLEPSMFDRIEEHLQRQFESLGQIAAAILLRDARIDQAEPAVEPVDLGEGVMPIDLLKKLLRDWVPQATPIVVNGRNGARSIERQIDMLAG